MVENRTVIGACILVLIIQVFIWKIYTANHSSTLYKLDGPISDPRHGLRSLKCRTEKEGNITTDAIQIPSGGHFKPKHCEPRDVVAIFVPYRDREEHLKTFLDYIHPFLKPQLIEYVIYVVELAMPTTFNKGLLINVGVLESKHSGINFTCYIVHDVDLLPMDKRNLYVCSDGPRHMSTSNSNYLYKLPYGGYIGGVVSFPPSSYEKINGFSNLYFGWGGEDDDLGRRLDEAGYSMQRVPEDIGIYEALNHGSDEHNPVNTMKYKLLDGSKTRMKTDGLNSVKYTLLKSQKLPLYTWLYVTVNQSDYQFT